jgi:predicted HicB family RNase H-like nuclease
MSLKNDHYTYRVTWSEDDHEYVGLCVEFPSLSWLADSPEAALRGVRRVVEDVLRDMQSAGENIPEAISTRHYSGKFMVRIPPQVHRKLMTEAIESGVSLNRLVSAKLSHE